MFLVKPLCPNWSVGKPEAKDGVSHFWLCDGQGGVFARSMAFENTTLLIGEATAIIYSLTHRTEKP
jgi:hypothetical protein